jgi:hypothetical protein
MEQNQLKQVCQKKNKNKSSSFYQFLKNKFTLVVLVQR